MARRVLVVSTVEHGEDVLRAQIGGADEIKVVVPVVRQGALDWLANDQKAFGHAERVAERTAQELPGETVEAVAGEADVGLAIRDALATFPADEIVVAVRPRTRKGSSSRSRRTAPHSDRSKECPSATSSSPTRNTRFHWARARRDNESSCCPCYSSSSSSCSY